MLVCPPKFLFKEIRNSFINVEHISLDQYRAPISEFPFSSTFPNLKSLELQLGWNGPTPIAFPSVKKLCIDAWKSKKNEYKGLHFEANEINELLRLNPQLEELELNNGISDTIFQDINLPELKRFSPRMRYYPNIKNADRYHFENVIDFRFDIFHNGKITNIPFTFSKLERFECSCYANDGAIESYILDFIDENKYLKSIILTGVRGRIDSLLQRVSVLPNIEELSVEAWARPVSSNFDLISNLFSKNPSFKKFTLWGWQKYLENLISETDSAKLKNFKQETEFVRYTTTLTWT
ncbi:uncharacterized protein LOC129571678 [Sitodiplosis mosellana]|uniref:uncharacterized protein LOC129571678 n=1 Tax=Sitodiplosis mosellana TaxID=263140 RepID=UPI0024451AF8|nr:uncharacterized protein LOC129571678 [Sitodiplosis mosellana]